MGAQVIAEQEMILPERAGGFDHVKVVAVRAVCKQLLEIAAVRNFVLVFWNI
jgi:hypothetical protein